MMNSLGAPLESIGAKNDFDANAENEKLVMTSAKMNFLMILC